MAICVPFCFLFDIPSPIIFEAPYRYQNDIDQPSDAKQACRKQVQDPHAGTARIEVMCPKDAQEKTQDQRGYPVSVTVYFRLRINIVLIGLLRFSLGFLTPFLKLVPRLFSIIKGDSAPVLIHHKFRSAILAEGSFPRSVDFQFCSAVGTCKINEFHWS